MDLQNLDNEYYRSALLGAKVNIAPDTPASSIKEITTFKSLTSELDVISSRAPYEKVKQRADAGQNCCSEQIITLILAKQQEMIFLPYLTD